MMDRKECELFSDAKQLYRAMESFHVSQSGLFDVFFRGGKRLESELSSICQKEMPSQHVGFAESRPSTGHVTVSAHVKLERVNSLASARSSTL